MVCKIKCAAITGIDTQPVIVETDICNGLPSFDMVGLLASNIKESRERVRTAIKNSGFMIPPKRITINFSPANIRKTGTYFDLPVAVSILMSMGLINCTVDSGIIFTSLTIKVFKYYIPFLEKSYEKSMNILKRFPLGAI